MRAILILPAILSLSLIRSFLLVAERLQTTTDHREQHPPVQHVEASNVDGTNTSFSSFIAPIVLFALPPEEMGDYSVAHQRHPKGSTTSQQQQQQYQSASLAEAPWHKDTIHPLCTRDEVRNGTWVPTLLEKGPAYVTQTTHLRCYPKAHFDQRPYPTWQWKPNNDKCDFTKFRRELMCRLLVDATVMIVGDSLSWEHYSSLVQLTTQKPIHQGYQHQSLEFRTNIVQHLECGNDGGKKTTNTSNSSSDVVRLVYRRDDKLQDLLHAVQQDFPTVLVLNRGAHYTNDTDLTENILNNMQILQKHWWKECERLGMQCHLFWRTSVPGHPHCQQFTHPVNNRTAMETWVGNLSNYNDRTIKYHWYDYQRQNLLVERLWRDKANIPVTILDAYDINILRPDEHRSHQDDCLHNCYPGKMDVYSQLMLHYLRMDRTLQGVQHQKLVSPGLVKSSAEPTKYDREGWRKARAEREERKKKQGFHSSPSLPS
jgi:hypothetical protein